jgi:hypothetical protein
LLAVRVIDVAPDGASERVTYGLLNLTHREGDERPLLLNPGERYLVNVMLNDTAHAFSPGHKIRLAISTCYWPIAWPAPEPVTLTVFTGKSFVDLPVRAADAGDVALRRFDAPERAATEATEPEPAALKHLVERNRERGEMVHTVSNCGDSEAPLLHIKAIDLKIGHSLCKRFRIAEANPQTARAEIIGNTLFRRDDWEARVDVRTSLSSKAGHFILEAELAAYEGGRLFFSRSWARRIERKLL